MGIKKIGKKRLELGRKVEGMEKSCFIDLENVVSKGTLTASNRGENKSYLVKEIEKPTPRKLRAKLWDKSKLIEDYESNSILRDFLSEILTELFEGKPSFRNKVDNIFALSDFYQALKNPGEISQLIDWILTICEEDLGGVLSRIDFEKPKIAGNELKARIGALGSRRILETKSQSIESIDCYLDFSTYISGITLPTSEESKSGLVSGLGLKILDALAKGAGKIDRDYGTTNQLPTSDGKVYEEIADDFASRASELVNVARIPSGSKRIGNIPVEVEESYRKRVSLIGCDVGENGDKLDKIVDIGQRVSSYGVATLQKLIDKTFVRLVGNIIQVLYEEKLIDSGSTICISSRQSLTESQLEIIPTYLEDIGYQKIAKKMSFVKNPASFGILEMKNQGLDPLKSQYN